MGDAEGMCLLRVAEPNHLERVCEFFRSAHVAVRVEGKRTVAVSMPSALTPLHGRREIAGYVATWNALNPASPLEMIVTTA